MSEKYKTQQGDNVYFVTFTIVDWLNVLEHKKYIDILVDCIKYYQLNKGLRIFGYCIMPNHVHMIVQGTEKWSVSEILRDLKKISNRKIVQALQEEDTKKSGQILSLFKEAADKIKRVKNFKVWQDGNHAILLYSNKFYWQKLNYIHMNPVKKGLCINTWDYEYSSARDYTGHKSVLDVVCLDKELRTY
ncbi:MAG: transposase [Lentimicrobium sp.]|nr:transposase [Lentimicrobium sp.]